MAFVYERVIRFHETDAAGVVYFANLLTLCHEAYEASLGAAGVNLKTFFSRSDNVAVPIVHAEADFYRPLFCGDAIAFTLTAQPMGTDRFEIHYTLTAGGLAQSLPQPSVQTDHAADVLSDRQPLARALTQHVCINLCDRRRQPLTPELRHWLDWLDSGE